MSTGRNPWHLHIFQADRASFKLTGAFCWFEVISCDCGAAPSFPAWQAATLPVAVTLTGQDDARYILPGNNHIGIVQARIKWICERAQQEAKAVMTTESAKGKISTWYKQDAALTWLEQTVLSRHDVYYPYYTTSDQIYEELIEQQQAVRTGS